MQHWSLLGDIQHEVNISTIWPSCHMHKKITFSQLMTGTRVVWSVASEVRYNGRFCEPWLYPVALSNLEGHMYKHYECRHTIGLCHGAEPFSHTDRSWQHAVWLWSGPCLWNSLKKKKKLCRALFKLLANYSKALLKFENGFDSFRIF